MSKQISVSYSLLPPEKTSPPQSDGKPLAASATLTYPLSVKGSQSNEEYYKELRIAVQAARENMGRRLTGWRDAVGEGEREKERRVLGTKAGKAKGPEEEEEEEEGEEEEGDV